MWDRHKSDPNPETRRDKLTKKTTQSRHVVRVFCCFIPIVVRVVRYLFYFTLSQGLHYDDCYLVDWNRCWAIGRCVAARPQEEWILYSRKTTVAVQSKVRERVLQRSLVRLALSVHNPLNLVRAPSCRSYSGVIQQSVQIPTALNQILFGLS